MPPQMEVSLHVDHQRDVVSIGFAPLGGRRREQAGRRHIQAVRMEQLAPNVVARYDDDGRLVGLDFFGASRLLGTGGGPGLGLAVRVSHSGQGSSHPARQKEPGKVPEKGDDRPGDDGSRRGREGGGKGPFLRALPASGRRQPSSRKDHPVPEPLDPAAPASEEAGARPRRPGLLARFRARISGHRVCPHCGRLYDPDKLKFKRFLHRQEAEAMEKRHRLKSHFVYGCPHCRGDLFDL